MATRAKRAAKPAKTPSPFGRGRPSKLAKYLLKNYADSIKPGDKPDDTAARLLKGGIVKPGILARYGYDAAVPPIRAPRPVKPASVTPISRPAPAKVQAPPAGEVVTTETTTTHRRVTTVPKTQNDWLSVPTGEFDLPAKLKMRLNVLGLRDGKDIARAGIDGLTKVIGLDAMGEVADAFLKITGTKLSTRGADCKLPPEATEPEVVASAPEVEPDEPEAEPPQTDVPWGKTLKSARATVKAPLATSFTAEQLASTIATAIREKIAAGELEERVELPFMKTKLFAELDGPLSNFMQTGWIPGEDVIAFMQWLQTA